MKAGKCSMSALALIPAYLFIALLSVDVSGNRAFAATLGEILDQGRSQVLAGQDLAEVISKSVATAKESDIPFDTLAAPLAETLLEAGIQMNRDAAALAGDIAARLFFSIKNTGVDEPMVFRSVSRAIQGLRAGAAKRGVDTSRVRAEIQRSLEMAAYTTEMAQQMNRLVESTYEEAHAATYTAPPPPPPAAPAPPPGPIGDAYDPTASGS